MWLGYGFKAGNAFFRIPDGRGTEYVEGVFNAETNLVKFRNCTWFTNLDHKKRHEELILFHKYSPEEYPKYDNYDAIDVGKTAEIPVDYDGVMGVPITFLDKYNPEQFEIVGITDRNSPLCTKVYTKQDATNYSDLNRRSVLIINGKYKMLFPKLLIRKKK